MQHSYTRKLIILPYNDAFYKNRNFIRHYTHVNNGVPEFGLVSGISTFNITGIGKSTPIKIASPDPKTGKKAKVSLFADEQALAIASDCIGNLCDFSPLFFMVPKDNHLNKEEVHKGVIYCKKSPA